MSVDDPIQPSQPSSATANEEQSAEYPAIQPGEEDDFEQAVSFLTTYESPEPVEYPGDESIWPVLNRTLKVCVHITIA